MKMTKFITPKIILVFFLCASFFLLGYNTKNNVDFFKAPMYAVLNILIALVFAFYFSQKLNDHRKLKDVAEKILDEVKKIISCGKYYLINEFSNKDELMMMQKTINTKIVLLKEVSTHIDFEPEMRFIDEKFEEYKEIIGNHIMNLAELQAMSKDIKRPLDLIDIKIDEIKIGFYLNKFKKEH